MRDTWVRALVKLSYKVVKAILVYSPFPYLGRPLGRIARREVERNRRWSTENIDIIVGLRVAYYFEIDPDNLGRRPHALRK